MHTAVAPVANGTSNPPAETTLRNLEAEGFEHGLDLEALALVSDHFRALAADRGLPLGAPAEYDAAYYRHQMPGGMVTTTRRQLEEMGRADLFDAAVEEVTRVRAEMGYPIMVTPVSQFVVTQAVANVLSGKRWSSVSDETVRYFLGHFYEPAAPVDPEVADRVLSLPRAAELRDLEPISLEGARSRFGERISEEELLLRLTMPAEQVDAMVGGASAAPPPLARPGRDPLVRLLAELAKRDVGYVRVEKGDDLVVWRRAA